MVIAKLASSELLKLRQDVCLRPTSYHSIYEASFMTTLGKGSLTLKGLFNLGAHYHGSG